MSFLAQHHFQYHPESADSFSRLLLISLLIHTLVFFIFFGNPFRMRVDHGSESDGFEKRFDVQLLSFPNLDRAETKHLPLALFPAEREAKQEMNGNGEAFSSIAPSTEAQQDSAPSQMSDFEQIKRAMANGTFKEIPVAVLNRKRPPLVTSNKTPANMTGPQDCMIKVVGMVCPNGDVKCIAEYKTFCATLPD